MDNEKIISECYKLLALEDDVDDNMKKLQVKWNMTEDQILSAILFLVAY